MADRVWRGDAVAVKQVVTVDLSLVGTSGDYVLRINGKDLIVPSAVASDMATLISSSSIPEWREVVATGAGALLTITSRTAGIPFKVTALSSGIVANGAIVVTVKNQPTGGTWLLSYTNDSGTTTTANVTYNSSAATLQGQTDTLFGAGNTEVSLAYDRDLNAIYTIRMTGSLANVAVPNVSASYGNLTGGDAAVDIEVIQDAIAGTDCVQTVTIQGGGSGGVRGFRFRGYTATVPYNASAGTLEAAFRALPSVGNNVDVTGTANVSYVFTFRDDLGHLELPNIEVLSSGVTGGTVFATVDQTVVGVPSKNQMNYVWHSAFADSQASIFVIRTTSGGWSAGSWTIDINGTPTASIPFDATDAEIASIIEDRIGHKGVVVTITPGQYGLFFIGPVYSYNLVTVVVNSAITGGSVSLSTFNSGADNADPTPIGFTYKLKVNGVVGADVSRTASLLTIQNELDAVCGVGNSIAIAQEQSGNLNSQAGLYRVEFRAALAGQVVSFEIVNDTIDADTTGQIETTVYQQGEATGANAVQTLELHGTIVAGAITATYGGFTTAAIPYDATFDIVDAAFNGLPNLGDADTTASNGPFPGSTIPITFGGVLSYTPVSPITVNDDGIKAVVVQTTPGVTGKNEKVQLSLTGQEVWGGTATLTVDATPLAAINATATFANLQSALTTALGANKATASAGPWPETPLVIEYTGDNAETTMPAITATDDLKNGLAILKKLNPLNVRMVTRATSSSHWSDPVNWFNPAAPSVFLVPQPGDTVWLTDFKTDVLFGLVQRVVFTADATGDWLVPNGDHDLQNDQAVHVWTSDALPGGLSASTIYYIRELDPISGRFRLAATVGGVKINLTNAGTGTHQVGVRLARMVTLSKCVAKVGLPLLNSGGYMEYRATYLRVGILPGSAQTVTVGQGTGQGSSRIQVDTGTDQVLLEVLDSGSSTVVGVPAVLWLGNHASNQVKVRGGDLGIALALGEYAAGTSIEMTGGTLSMGPVSFTTYDATGGQLLRSDKATFSQTINIRLP